MPVPGYLYCVSHPAFPGYSKIGRTTSPSRRLRAYNTGCPTNSYRLDWSLPTPDCLLTELIAHHKLDGYRATGEWFSLNPIDAYFLLMSLEEKPDT